jgi:hypothetical protein
MAGQLEVGQLIEKLDRDKSFGAALESDAFDALGGAGFGDLQQAVEQERDRIAELVDRIYEDARFREAIADDPTGTLGEWGLPEAAVEPLLLVVGAPDDVVERATADVEAHLGKKPATVAAVTAVLGALALGQQASAATHPGAKAEVARPGAKPQVSHVATAVEVSQPVSKTLIKQARASYELAGVRSAWHGAAARPDAKWQAKIVSILRAQGSLAR